MPVAAHPRIQSQGCLTELTSSLRFALTPAAMGASGDSQVAGGAGLLVGFTTVWLPPADPGEQHPAEHQESAVATFRDNLAACENACVHSAAAGV